MAQSKTMDTCRVITWLIAALGGVLVFLAARADTSFVLAFLVAAAFTAFLGLALSATFCAPRSGGAKEGAEDLRGNAMGVGASGPNSGSSLFPEAQAARWEFEGGERREPGDTMSDPATAPTTSVGAPETPAAVGVPEPAQAAEEVETAAEEIPTSEADIPDYDQDGVLEGENEGRRPEALSAARNGKPDDLKQIKGIGPKLEQMCHSLGFFHFDQIASWSDQEVAWVNANLQGFKGRVTRDDWVAQAKILAAGEETEFSKRVEDGKVY